MKYIIFFLCIISVGACLPMDKNYSIDIRNNSPKSIYYYGSDEFPDTLLPKSDQYLYEIKANENQKILGNPHNWEGTFTEYFPKDTMIIFFLNPETVHKYSWDTICKHYMIVMRQEYSKDDLKKNNWVIYYP
jgi:hypothetical protein